MNNPAAFQATFTDWRLVKGRKVVQCVFEVPLEVADEAYQVLGGMPDPGASVWCAIARLKPESEVRQDTGSTLSIDTARPQPHKTRPAPTPIDSARALTRKAAILCKDPLFHAWLKETNSAWRIMTHGSDEEKAAAIVRAHCGVKSRTEIIPGTPEGMKWDAFYGEFSVWRDAPELQAS